MRDFRKLDRSRPFGTVHGEGVKHSYEQDGLCYDFQERLLEETLTPETRKRLDELEIRERAREAARRAEEAELRKAGLLDDGSPAPEPVKRGRPPKQAEREQKSDDGPQVDLVAWYRGTTRYVFDQVAAAINDKYSIEVQDAENARLVIAEQESLAE